VGVAVTLIPRLRASFPGGGTAVATAIEGLPVVRVLAHSRTTEAALVVLPDGSRAVRKRRVWPTARDRAKGALRTTVAAPSPARRERDALLRLRELPGGPFAPEPLGFADERRAGVLHRCLLLVEEVPDAVDLAAFLVAERDAARRAAVLADLARRTREMHAAGLLDREHHPRNVLVAGTRTWKVDCWKQRVRRSPVAASAATEDLAALDVGFVRLATPAERSAFLTEYLGRAPSAAFLRALDKARSRIDARESRRLPATERPVDNDR
jgi:hypothetical protein